MYVEGLIFEDVILVGVCECVIDIGVGVVILVVGVLLCLLVKFSGGKVVVEVGIGVGVSGLWLLLGMCDDGVLIIIDIEFEYLCFVR